MECNNPDILKLGIEEERKKREKAEKLLEEIKIELSIVYQKLKKAQKETEGLLSTISLVLIEINRQGFVKRWNSAAEKIFRIAESAIVGRLLGLGKVEWPMGSLQDHLADCELRKVTHFQKVKICNKLQESRFLNVTLTVVTNDSDKITGYLILAYDVTEQVHLESQLAQAQKLESIGQLAAGIAHEINTPMQFVSDNTRFVQESFGEIEQWIRIYRDLLNDGKEGLITLEKIANIEEDLREAEYDYLSEEIPLALTQSLEGIDRVVKIVNSMKKFSHPGVEKKTEHDVNDSLETTVTVAGNEWKYVADVEFDLDKNLPSIPCFPAELNQVFLNLIVNAAHAIEDTIKQNPDTKGKIYVSTRQVDNQVEIRITDTGSGIPEEIRSKVFDLFFTTKEVGKGTGQGLALAHKVIHGNHGGTIELESEVGKGTTFVIRLPIDPEDAISDGSESQIQHLS